MRDELTFAHQKATVVGHDMVGRTNTYRLNTEHLAAEPILALSRLAHSFLSRLEEHSAKWQEPSVYAAVFRSAATGRMTLASDIDLSWCEPT